MGTDPPAAESEQARYLIHEIPQSQWPNGIPAVMGAHLMPSGEVAPISTSKGPGDGNVPHVFQYHTEETDITVVQNGNFDAAAHAMSTMVQTAAGEAIAEKGSFTLVLSGGSLLKALSKLSGVVGADFSKWWIFYVDERNVPHSSDDSTHKGAKENFLDAAGVPSVQVFEIHEGLSVKEAAKNYEGRLFDVPKSVLPRNESGWPVFDCMLLGTGPDGHIASLFPNSSALGDKSGWILPIESSPKPPPERITMTLPVINACKKTIFLATGSGKAEVVRRVLECQALPGALPAQLVRPTAGTVTWLLDVESSAELQISSWEDKKAYPRSTV
jgi:6-phosphogluconolactonase